MAIPQQMTDALAKIDTATTSLGAVVTGLRDKIKTGMSDADVAAVDAKLAAVATALEGIAADPADPVPGPLPSP